MLLLLPEIKSISYSPLPVSTLTELSLFVFYGINSVLLLYLIIIAQLKPLLASWVLKQLATLRLKEKEYLLHIDKPR